MAGITETKELLKAGIKFTFSVIRASRGGLKTGEIMAILASVFTDPVLRDGFINGIKAIPGEIKDLEPTEITDLVAFVAAEVKRELEAL